MPLQKTVISIYRLVYRAKRSRMPPAVEPSPTRSGTSSLVVQLIEKRTVACTGKAHVTERHHTIPPSYPLSAVDHCNETSALFLPKR